MSATGPPGEDIAETLPDVGAAGGPGGISDHRRRAALGAGRERRIPRANLARMAERRAGELQRRGMRIGAGPDVVPVEDELPEGAVPARWRRGKDSVPEAIGCRVGVGIE